MAAHAPVPNRLTDYFVICGLDASSGLEPDRLSGDKLQCAPLDRPFKSKVLAHYPESVPWNTFDKAAVGMLCMPRGLSFKTHRDKRSSSFHSFLITREDGSHSFGSALVFYEEVTSPEVCTAMQTLHTMHSAEALSSLPLFTLGSDDSPELVKKISDRRIRDKVHGFDSSRDKLYVTKCICLVTSLPYMFPCRNFLQQLYDIAMKSSPSALPLEAFVYNVIYDVPLLPPGRSMKFYGPTGPIFCQRPNLGEPPLFDFPLWELFRLLGVDNMLSVFMCVLLEHQVLFYSSDYQRLMLVAEGLNCLIFPFTWQHVYVPILPASLTHFLDAPVPYIMGLYRSSYEDRSELRLPSEASMCFVDLDEVTVEVPEDLPIFPYSGDLRAEIRQLLNRYHAIFTKEKQASSQPTTPRHGSKGGGLTPDPSGTGSYPNSPKRMEILQQSEAWKKISNLAKKTGVWDSIEDFAEEEAQHAASQEELKAKAAAEQQLLEGKETMPVEELEHLKFNNATREIFLNCFVHMFLGYENFVVNPAQDMESWLNNRETMHNFDKAAFLSDQPESHLPFLSPFIETQMFATMIDNKIMSQWEETDPYLCVFDTRIKALRDTSAEARTFSFHPCSTIEDTDDENLCRMETVFMTPTGRGRPPKLLPVPLTNKLLLQLEFLRLQASKSWDDLFSLYLKVTEDDPLQGISLKSEIEAVVKEGRKCKNDGTDEDFDAFLSVNVGICISGRNVGPHLTKNQIFRHHLLNPDQLQKLTPPSELTHGMIIDVMLFLKKENLPLSRCRTILEFLGVTVKTLSDQHLTSKLNRMLTMYKSLSKSIHRQNGQTNMNCFLLGTPDFTMSASASKVPVTPPTEKDRAVAHANMTAASLRRQLEETERELASEKEKNNILRETSLSHCRSLHLEEGKVASLKKKHSNLQDQHNILVQQLNQTQQTIRGIRATNMYKRLKRKEHQLNKKQAVLAAHENGCCARKERTLRHKVKLEQTKTSNLRKEVEKLRTKLESRLAQHEQTVLDLLRNEGHRVVQTRKEGCEEFTDDVKKTTIALIAAQVSAENCPRVINTVAKYLFDVDIPLSSLPSERTVRRYADQGHVLAKIQVAEAVVSNTFDIHSDGTTRDKRKYIGYQVTTSEGPLSCGFTTVASENASTLVETTLTMLQELSEVFCPEEKEHYFRQILQNLSGVMTDRAAVMKKYKKDLNDAVQATLGTQESIEFLGCNAHFLLGLSSKSNTTLTAIQKERDKSRIGRDLEPQFQRFSTPEAAAVRYIRMACEVLGPRGDEKSGCRDAWIAFCALNEKPSVISSFKANRFNNLFEAAAALTYHRDDIITFLRDYMPDKNSKLQSVLADATSDQVAVYLLTLALLYFRLTGPYWRLLGSRTHYLDFYKHVVQMKDQLDQWSQNGSTIFSAELPPLFGQQMQDCASFRAAIQVAETTKQQIISIYQSLCGELITVVDLQLSDFLPQGRYHAVTDPAMRQKLAHSQITNLLGEACFGDLDLSIYKRRNASCHHHASITMLVRNKTMDRWFNGKTEEAQGKLLKLSARHGKELRRRHRQDEHDVVAQTRLILVQNKQRHEDQKMALMQKKNDIIRSLRQHRGPCQTPDDVDHLLQRFGLQRERRAALQAEMNYHKVVLGVKSPLLRTALPSIVRLAENLRNYLEGHLVAVQVPADPLCTAVFIDKRATHIDHVAPKPQAPSSTEGLAEHKPGVFPILSATFLNTESSSSKSRSRENAKWRRKDRSLQHAEHLQLNSDQRERYIQEARSKQMRQPQLSDMSAAGMVQTNWKFVETLLKECKTKTKKMLVEKMGQEAVELGHGEGLLTGVEENTLIASLCDLLERIWSHGLQTKKGKSAVWSHLLSFQEVIECNETSNPIDPKMLTPGLPKRHSLIDITSLMEGSITILGRSISLSNLSTLGLESDKLEKPVTHTHRRRSSQGRIELPVLRPLPKSLNNDMKKVQKMTDIRSDVGYTRAWVRLALERKMLSTHLKELLSDASLLRALYKRYAFLRCEDEREQFLYHLLSLNAVDFFCFTNTFANTVVTYRVLVFPSTKLGCSTTSANVWLSVAGQMGDSGRMELQKGLLELTFEHKNMGVLTTMRIGHDNSGMMPRWLVEYILVRNELTGHTYRFNCGRWLGKGVDDGSTERLLVAELVHSTVDTESDEVVVQPVPRSSSPKSPRKTGDSNPTMPELQEMMGHAVNNLVKHFYKPEKERGNLTFLLCGEKGLVQCMEQVFQYGFRSSRLFRNKIFIWDYLDRLRQYFSNALDNSSVRPIPEVSKAGYWLFCNLLKKIDQASEAIGKDGKFQIFICVGIRDRCLHRWLPLMANTTVTAQMYEENSFMRNPSLTNFIVHILDSLTEFDITLESSLLRGLDI